MTMLFYNLPETQRRVLHFIIRNIEEHSESPTLDEIGAALEMTKQNVHQAVCALEKKGRITRTPNAHRSITIVNTKEKL